jgi:Zn finger protein HypA/HybF involved in hydrogenase expression
MDRLGSQFLTLYIQQSQQDNSLDHNRKPLSLNILNTTVIPKRGPKSKWTLELVKQQGRYVHGDKYDYSLITNAHVKCSNSPVPIRCLECDYIWETSIHHHINHKSGCPDCAGKLKWTLERFIQRSHSIHGDIYDYSMITREHIQGKDSHIPIRCKICDYIWESSIHGHINGKTGCPDCAGRVPWTLDRFLQKSYSVHGDKYDYSMVTKDHIQGKDSHIPIRCKNCDNIWTPSIHSHTYSKQGCPKCKFSKGEIACANILDKLGIVYEIQYKIKSLPNKRYDFMFIYDNISYLLEFEQRVKQSLSFAQDWYTTFFI